MWPFFILSASGRAPGVTAGTDGICDAAMPLKLVAGKLARLGAGGRVGDSACAAEDVAVE